MILTSFKSTLRQSISLLVSNLMTLSLKCVANLAMCSNWFKFTYLKSVISSSDNVLLTLFMVGEVLMNFLSLLVNFEVLFTKVLKFKNGKMMPRSSAVIFGLSTLMLKVAEIGAFLRDFNLLCSRDFLFVFCSNGLNVCESLPKDSSFFKLNLGEISSDGLPIELSETSAGLFFALKLCGEVFGDSLFKSFGFEKSCRGVFQGYSGGLLLRNIEGFYLVTTYLTVVVLTDDSTLNFFSTFLNGEKELLVCSHFQSFNGLAITLSTLAYYKAANSSP